MRQVLLFASLPSLIMCGCAAPGAARAPSAGQPAPGSPSTVVRFAPSSDGLPTTDTNWKCDPVLADLNKDGHMDLIAFARLSDGVYVWHGNGQGQWRNEPNWVPYRYNSCGGGLAVGDVNGDGNLDIAAGDHCRGAFVYLGDGSGTRFVDVIKEQFPREVVPQGGILEDYVGAEDIDLGDCNGDGHLDLLVGGSDRGGVQVWLGDGSGTNWKYQRSDVLPMGGWAMRVMFVDANNDKKLDIAANYCEGPRVYLGDGSGKFRDASKGLPRPQIKGLFKGLAVGDLNNDGRADLATANYVDGPEVYYQRPDGSWDKQRDIFPDMIGGAFGLSLGDLDQDGWLDMVVSGRLTREVGYIYGTFLLRNAGNGRWQYLADCGLPNTGLSFSWGTTVGDFTNDGVPDIVACSGGVVATPAADQLQKPVFEQRVHAWRNLMAPK